MKNIKTRLLVIMTFLLLSFFSLNAQDSTNTIEGTFTIYMPVNSKVKLELNDQQKLQISKSRQAQKNTEIYISGYKVIVMSQEKVDAEVKWPKYAILND